MNQLCYSVSQSSAGYAVQAGAKTVSLHAGRAEARKVAEFLVGLARERGQDATFVEAGGVQKSNPAA